MFLIWYYYSLLNYLYNFSTFFDQQVSDKEVDSLLSGELLPNEDEIQEIDQFDAPDYISPEMVNNPKEVFLNSWSQDKLLSNLISGSYNTNALNGNKTGNSVKKENDKEKDDNSNTNHIDMAVATRDSPHIPLNRLNSA